MHVFATWRLARGCTRHAVVAAALGAVLAACGDEPTALAPPALPNRAVVGTTDTLVDIRSEFPTVRRVDVKLTATGPFRPGQPITVHAVARANRPSTSTRVEFIVLDVPAAPGVGDGSAPRSYSLGDWGGPLAPGAEATLRRTVTFAEPGYYQVLARAASRRPVDDPRDRDAHHVIDSTYETLYIVVDERGGRLTAGFDPGVAVDTTRTLLYGSSGPFRDGPRPRGPTAGAGGSNGDRVKRRGDGGGGDVGIASVTTGVVQYYNNDINASAPVVNALLTVTCTGPDGFSSSYQVRSDAGGNFTAQCFDNESTSIATRLSNSLVNVAGSEGAAVFGDVYLPASSSGSQVTIVAGNRYAAHVYQVLDRYAPLAQQRFGRSRSVLPVYVSDADGLYGPDWGYGGVDRVRHNYSRTFGEDGVYVAVHEYGHAFHNKAIEPWRSYYCSPNGQHSRDEQLTLSCGFVEGFADFFAAWIGGAGMSNYYYGDHAIESNPSRTVGDGSKVEGAVAALFLDMVDGPSDPDAASGGSDNVDDDTMQWSGTYVADLIRTCEYGVDPRYTQIDGADHFAYCAERNKDAWQANPYGSWRKYGYVGEGAAEPASWTAAKVRASWRYNFYNLGANP